MIKEGNIPATCNHCKDDVNVPVEDVNLLVNPETNQGSYAFTCKKCGGAVVKLANATVIELLEGRGVKPLSAVDVSIEQKTGSPDIDEFLDTAANIRRSDSETLWAELNSKN